MSVPRDKVVRELPKAREAYPCALVLPRVVLHQKGALPHQVQVHKGTPFTCNGHPFRLRDEGILWTYAPRFAAPAR